jgi:uncharacterized protein YndB with AHSA1/START domain
VHTTYESIGGRPALRFERRIAHPVEAVWGAITEPAELEQWFPTTVGGEMRAGGELTFTFVKHDIPPMTGAVTDFDPPSLLAFYWGEDHLRFELSPADDLAHTDLRFTVLLDSADKAARDGAGWHGCLDRLDASLDGADEHTLKAINDGWREHYDEYAGRGFPATAPVPDTAP